MLERSNAEIIEALKELNNRFRSETQPTFDSTLVGTQYANTLDEAIRRIIDIKTSNPTEAKRLMQEVDVHLRQTAHYTSASSSLRTERSKDQKTIESLLETKYNLGIQSVREEVNRAAPSQERAPTVASRQEPRRLGIEKMATKPNFIVKALTSISNKLRSNKSKQGNIANQHNQPSSPRKR